MKILITGASGFIGKNLTEFFSEKYHVFAPTHKQLNLLDEIAVLRYFQNHSIDIVIHCAVIGGNRAHQYVKGMFYDNIRMFFNIVNCRKYYKRMIHINSGAIYDKRYPIVNIKEDALGKHIPVDDYGLYKYICANYINSTDNSVDLRVFGIFGEGEDYRHRFISYALRRCIQGLPIVINRNVFFDYLDIKDFINIIDYFVHHKSKFRAYNVGRGKKISLLSIAKMIQKLNKLNKNKIIIRTKNLGDEYSCNTQTLRDEVPQLTVTPLKQSLTRLYNWYKEQTISI